MTETERQEQIEWFRSLLEVLEQGDTATARKSIEGAIKMLERKETT